MEKGKKNPSGDINFEFNGFSVKGEILSKNLDGTTIQGPTGIEVHLLKDSKQIIQTVTTQDGKFQFTKILPRDYLVVANHKKWKVSKKEILVSVKDSMTLPSEIFVEGFNVKGTVFSNNFPMVGVEIFLYSQDTNKKNFIECENPSKGPLEGKSSLCVSTSDKDGQFEFESVPNGNYLAVPFYRGFKISPSEIKFIVDKGTIILSESFQVKGFVVRGSVVNTDQKGIEGVKIIVNGENLAITDSNGEFILEEMTSGKYTIDAQKEHMMFNKLEEVEIFPNTGKLNPISISHFDICGKVSLHSKDIQTIREISLQMENSPSQLTTTNQDGKFCFRASVTDKKHKVKAIVTPQEEKLGLKLLPKFIEVTLKNSPILNLKFEQTFYEIHGTVICKSDSCNKNQFRLVNKDRNFEQMNDSLTFKSLLPGKYEISILNSNICWEKETLELDLEDNIQNLEFIQKGVFFQIESSHDHVTLKLDQEIQYSLSKGKNKICIEKKGIFHLLIESCFKFKNEKLTMDASKPIEMKLEAIGVHLYGLIKSSKYDETLKIFLNKDYQAQLEKLNDQTIKYKFDIEFNQEIEIIPKSKSYLFFPSLRKVKFLNSNSCPSPIEDFSSKQGIFITGKVKPNISKAKIIVKQNGDIVSESETDSQGNYSVGPLYGDSKYEVECSKDGYKILRQSQHDFFASKFSSIYVNVLSQDQKPLSGVFLSLSGEGYRNNSLSEENGKIFENLFQGSFFLKPLLKEYIFEPETISFDLKEGENKEIKIIGKRIAYSCFGKVELLNGEAIQGVIVQAIHKNGEIEEGISDENGNYRIRGLIPNKEYLIQVKKGEHVERAYPTQTSITIEKDTHDIHFVVFKSKNQIQIYGNIYTSVEDKSMLSIELLSGSKVIRSTPFNINQFFFFLVPKEQTNFYIRIKTNSKFYKSESSLIQVYPNVNNRIDFEPELQEQSQKYGQENFYGIIVFVIIFFTFMYWQQISSLLK